MESPRSVRDRFAAVIAVAVASAGCGPQPRPAAAEDTAVATALRVDELIACGSYACLLEAHALRRGLHEERPDALERRRDRIEAALLVALRERQLAILGDAALAEAEGLLRDCGDCEAEAAMAGAVRAAPTRGAGIVRDLDPRRYRRGPAPGDPERWAGVLTARAATDPVATAFLLDLATSQARFLGDAVPAEGLIAAHRSSPLVRLSAALSGWGAVGPPAVETESAVAEAQLLLGRAARSRDPGAALSPLRVAAEGLPRSIAARLALGDLLFSLEDYAAALDEYDAVLRLAPEHRDAHLHRGQVLSLLGRPAESVEALGRLFELGNWYLGEAHYWTGLGHRELGATEAAGRHAANAKHWLPDDPRVFALAGRLALEREDLDAASDEFAAAVAGAARSSKDWSGDPSLCESHYSLGQIASQARDWSVGAARNEAAAACYGVAEERAAAAVAAVGAWSLDESRRAALVASRTRQVQQAAHQRAGSRYNAAVCHYRAGDGDAALEWARRAALHEAYVERVEKLIAALR